MSYFTVAIIGRPNVGKTLLFNYLTGEKGLVSDQPGVTRDRRYGVIDDNQFTPILLIDTGGIDSPGRQHESLQSLIEEQVLQAVEEADLLWWVLDGRAGVTSTDEKLVPLIRKFDKPVYLLANKLEGMDGKIAVADFYRFGFDKVLPISAKRGSGIPQLLKHTDVLIPDRTQEEILFHPEALSLCVLGKPNAGKSTFVNKFLGVSRMLISNQPGTTRDSICIPLKKRDKHYTITDTAGVRRSAKIQDSLERMSVSSAFFSVSQSSIVLFIIDASTGITDQDSSLLRFVDMYKKALVLIVNKWDLLDAPSKQRFRRYISDKYCYLDYAKVHFISSIHGSGVGAVFKTVERTKYDLGKTYSSYRINNFLQQCIATNPPPMIKGRRIKLRYAHIGGHNPFKIIIHGNQTDQIPAHYHRYLARQFKEKMQLQFVPVLIEFKRNKNPYVKEKRRNVRQRK